MIIIRRILCPIDFSDTSRHALAHAVAIAKWYESPITALHVSRPEPPMVFAARPSNATATATVRQWAEEQLRTWLEPADRAGVKTELLFDEGDPARQILERAALLPADLIVMGTHGLGGVERLMLGSVAEKVLRKSTCPVVTVPPPAAMTATLPYKRLLCPVDFSEPSLSALEFASSIAKESDAGLTILHVIDWTPDNELLVERFDAPEFQRVVEEQARGRLDALVTDDVRVWSRPVTKIGYGKPYRQILEIAGSEKTDLIVMGVRGRNPLDVMLFGSTTNHVVRRATCPVLTLKK